MSVVDAVDGSFTGTSVRAKKFYTLDGKPTRVVRLVCQISLKAFPRSVLFRWCKSDHQRVGPHDPLDNVVHSFKKVERGNGTKVPREDFSRGIIPRLTCRPWPN
jgi:hypothetical protein